MSRTIRSCIGTPLTTAQVLDTAILRFNTALAHPSIVAGDPIHSLASVGLGRALLDQGRFAEAAAAVAAVPADFLYETEHSTTPAALHNGIFEAFNNGEFGVEDQEGGNGLPYVSAADIRVTGRLRCCVGQQHRELVSQQVLRIRRVGPAWRITSKPN